jgi:hypothetical protein
MMREFHHMDGSMDGTSTMKVHMMDVKSIQKVEKP